MAIHVNASDITVSGPGAFNDGPKECECGFRDEWGVHHTVRDCIRYLAERVRALAARETGSNG